MYVRKTRDAWCIDTNWGYGWEEESRYTEEDYDDPFKSCKEDAKGYREAGARVRIVCRRERI